MSEPPLKKYKVTKDQPEPNETKINSDDLQIIIHPINPYYDPTKVINVVATCCMNFNPIIKFAS